MRIVADNPEEYKQLARIQKLITAQFKVEKEKDADSMLTKTYRAFIGTSIEKSYEMPGQSASVANSSSVMDTDDVQLFIAYVVHAAVNRKKAAIEYKDAKGNVSKRLIEPHTWRGNQVVAWCHERGAWRQFKPSQIMRIAITDQSFDREEDVEIVAEHAKEYAHLVNA